MSPAMQAQNRFQTSTPVPADQVSGSFFLSSSGWIILIASFGPFTEKELGDLNMAARLGEMKRPLPVRHPGVDIGSFIQQVFDELELACACGGSEGGEAFTLGVDISATLLDKEAQGVDSCCLESGHNLHQGDVRVSAMAEDDFGDIRIRQNQMSEFPAAGILEARAVTDCETDDIMRKLGFVPWLLPLTRKHACRKGRIAPEDFGDGIYSVAGCVMCDVGRRAI